MDRNIPYMLEDTPEEFDRVTGRLKTPDEWCEIKGIYIMDPDGWRHEDAPAWDKPISQDEFMLRAAESTTRRR